MRPCSPTWRVTHRPARSVIAARGGAIRASSPVHEPTGHDALTHSQRCFRHTSRTGRPNAARSTSSTSGRSLISGTHPHRAHAGRGPRVSTTSRNAKPGSSIAPSTFTSGRPTNSSQTRGRVNFHRGSPESDGVRHLQIRRAPVPRQGPTQPRSTRSAHKPRDAPDSRPVGVPKGQGLVTCPCRQERRNRTGRVAMSWHELEPRRSTTAARRTESEGRHRGSHRAHHPSQ